MCGVNAGLNGAVEFWTDGYVRITAFIERCLDASLN